MESCNELFTELLVMYDYLPASTLIKKIFETRKCDRYYPNGGLDRLRDDYRTYLNNNVCERILHDRMGLYDKRRAIQATVHYRQWTKEVLKKNISYWTYLRHLAQGSCVG